MGIQLKRGDIFFARLSPVERSEQGGTRPVLLIQNDIGNKHSPTVIIAAITGQTDKGGSLPTHLPIKCDGLEKESVVLMEQIRTIDKSRLGNHVGSISDHDMKKVDKALGVSLNI